MEEVLSKTLEGRFTALSACFSKNILQIFHSCLFICQELRIIPVFNVVEWWYRGQIRLCPGCCLSLVVEDLDCTLIFLVGETCGGSGKSEFI